MTFNKSSLSRALHQAEEEELREFAEICYSIEKADAGEAMIKEEIEDFRYYYTRSELIDFILSSPVANYIITTMGEM